jgi:hypothetical protein
MGDVIHLTLSTYQSRLLAQGYDFARALDEALGSIARTLTNFEAGDRSGSSLCALNIHLLDLLKSAERDPQIEAAVDHLYEVARRLISVHQRAVPSEHERGTDLATAYLRLRQQVVAARRSGCAVGADPHRSIYAFAILVARTSDQAHDQQAMPDGQQEREYLAQADQHIAESEQRLANQVRVIEWMIQNGHNTALAEECLLHLQQDLEQWRTDRQLILSRSDGG